MSAQATGVRCIACDADTFDPLYVVNGWNIVRCRACGFHRVHPLPTEKETADFYNVHEKPDQQRIGEYLRQKNRRRKRNVGKLKVIEQVQQNKGRILDIGCGLGLFVKDAKERGWEATGIDLDKDLIEYGKKEYGADLKYTTLDGVGFADASFDCITFYNVLDHLREPLPFLKEVSRVLKIGGVIYLNVHDASGWKARKHKEKWSAFCPPLHLHFYDLASLEALAHKAGLKYLRVPGVNLKEGIKMLLVKEEDPRKRSIVRRKWEGFIYGVVQTFKL